MEPHYHTGRGRDRGRWHGNVRGHHTRPSSGTGSHHNHSKTVGFKKLEEMSCTSSEDVIMFCCRDEFFQLLKQKVGDDWVHLILQCISNGFRADGFESYKQTLTRRLLDDDAEFLKETCGRYLIGKLQNYKQRGMYAVELLRTLETYLDTWDGMLSLDPSVHRIMWIAIDSLSCYLNSFLGDHLLTPLINRYRTVASNLLIKTKEENAQNKNDSRQQRYGRVMTENKPLDDFRNIPSFPLRSDIDSNMKVSIRKNKVKGGYDDPLDYLDIQFRLLREDFIGTIRNGLKEVRAKKFDAKRYEEVWLYHDLQILQPNFGKDGVTYFICFDPKSPRYRHMRWNSGKRLIFGSLLCISYDCFSQNMLFAKIVNSDPEQLAKEGVFEIQFLEGSEVHLSQCLDQRQYMAIESSAYYESYSHVLEGLKELASDTEHFPMQNYILYSSTTVDLPKYMRDLYMSNRSIPIIFYEKSGKPLPVMDISRGKVPSAENLGMDTSQHEAFTSALTSEFSVIQGPPGTGKTYLGLIIVKTLLHNLYGVGSNSLGNFPPMEKPILVVCFTNHALDQFLEGMLGFCETRDIVRVGGRSKSEKLKECNLRNRDKIGQLGREFYEIRANKQSFEESSGFQGQIELLNHTFVNIMPHTTPSFVTSYEHYRQLELFGRKSKGKKRKPRDAMTSWLDVVVNTGQIEVPPSEVAKKAEVLEIPENDLLEIEGENERELDIRGLDDDMENKPNPSMKLVRNFLKDMSDEPIAVADGFSDGVADTDGWETVVHKKSRTNNMAEIRKQLMKDDMMDEYEAASINDIRKLNGDDRWRLYRFWLHKFRQLLQGNIEQMAEDYEKICKREEELQNYEKVQILSQAKVIGMTTTGAAKNLHILQKIGAPIVVVEEAAEVLEAHIITSLSKHCQHLILIGDHKQLRPNTTTYDLAKQYHLDISLFERMVSNGFPVKMLNTQHRMRPEVKKFMDFIYRGLYNHTSVENREKIRGLSNSVFFFNHSNLEKQDEFIRSHSNLFEAEMISKLTRYLLSQDYKPSQITIITMYAGQLLLLQKRMPKSQFEGVKITTVDNFQGEENDIIILSTVRNNLKNKLGFVAIENRICVCLSRAKLGMYVFGNFEMLAIGSELWRNITDLARRSDELGKHLTLSCMVHKEIAKIEKPEDFDTKAPDGGCRKPCDALLKCGHRCKRSCHYKDYRHEDYRCTERCPRRCPNGHPCPEKCYITCPPCKVQKDFSLSCGHIQKDICSNPPEFVICTNPCKKILDCYHQCQKRCSDQCVCTQKTSKLCSYCDETKLILCGTKPPFPCDTRCSYIFDCRHQCKGNCSECRIRHKECFERCAERLRCGHCCEGTCSQCKLSHQRCTQKCGKMLPCGHLCQAECADCLSNVGCNPLCSQNCLLRCSHGQLCSSKCGDVCTFHVHNMDAPCIWGCEHDKCKRKCGEPCSHVPCAKYCQKDIKCSNCKQASKCIGLCSDPCPTMCGDCVVSKQPVLATIAKNNGKWIELQDCHHIIPESYANDIVGRNRNRIPKCPIDKCNKPILNTPRYVPAVRQEAYRLRLERELATMQIETETDLVDPEQDYIPPQPKLEVYERGRVSTSLLRNVATASNSDSDSDSSARYGSAINRGLGQFRARGSRPRRPRGGRSGGRSGGGFRGRGQNRGGQQAFESPRYSPPPSYYDF